MKKQFLNISVIVATLAWGTACEQEGQENQLKLNDAPTVGAVQNDVPQFEPELVATIKDKGYDLQFYGVGSEDVLVVEKLSDASQEAAENGILKGGESTPFDIFLATTDKGVAVPAIIANTAEGNAFEASGRSIDKMNTPIEIIGNNLPVASAENCTDVGSTNFRNNYCGGTVISNPSDIRFCDEGIYSGLTRSSYYGGNWEEVDDVNTWTNIICGITRLKFYDWHKSQWNLNTQIDFQDGVRYANYFTSKNRERKVERTRLSGTGFRAYTRLYK